MNKTSGQVSNNLLIERDFNMIQIAFLKDFQVSEIVSDLK